MDLDGKGGSWSCGLTDGVVVPRVRPAGRGATAARGHAGLKVETTQTTGLIDPLLTLKGWPGCHPDLERSALRSATGRCRAHVGEGTGAVATSARGTYGRLLKRPLRKEAGFLLTLRRRSESARP